MVGEFGNENLLLHFSVGSRIPLKRGSAAHLNLRYSEVVDLATLPAPQYLSPLGSAMESGSPTRITEKARRTRSSLLGSLHGQPCAVSDFSLISARFGRYELINGVLRFRPMRSGKHNKRARFLEMKGNDSQPPCSFMVASRECTVRYPGSYVIADVAVGRPSSSSADGEYPEDDPPSGVAEVTSASNWFDDFDKIEFYAKAGVAEFIIVHVHETFDAADGFPFGLYRYTKPEREIGVYAQHEFGESMHTTNFGMITVAELRNPPDAQLLLRGRHQALEDEIARLRKNSE